jgi:hypothetical protein
MRLLTKKHTALALIALLFIPLAAVPAMAQSGGSGLTLPVTGTFTDALGGVGQFTGTFNLQRFGVVNGQLSAIGTVTGTLTDSAGTVIGTVLRNLAIPVLSSATQASCQILHLELGPLDLNLLGLQVHLDRIVLDITAVPGAGNLLGNLLCAVANLLNGGGALSTIANLLNQILAAL